MAKKNSLKKVWGFALHFGYVESSRVSTIVVRHMGPGFDSLKTALRNLADYFMEGYLMEWCGYEYDLSKKRPYAEAAPANLEQFQYYLDQLPFAVASAGINEMSFDACHANDEQWWPWDQLHVLYPYFDKIYENKEDQLAQILSHYVDISKIPTNESGLIAELSTMQNRDIPDYWKLKLNTSLAWTPIKPRKKQ